MTDWSGEINDLGIGDMVKLGSSERLIRAKTARWVGGHRKKHSGYYFYFAIRRPSWTGKCWTMYSTYEMRQLFDGLIKRNCNLVNKDIDVRVQQEIFRVAYVNSYRDFPEDKKLATSEIAGTVL